MHSRSLTFAQIIGIHASTKQKHFQKMIPINSLKRSSTIVINALNRSKQTLSLAQSKFKFHKSFSYTSNVRFLLWLNSLKNIPEFLKSHSVQIVQNCVQNCECVLAQRIRRSQQMLCLYSKLWDEVTLQQFVNKFKNRLTKHRPFFLLASSFISVYDWKKERIPDEDILRYSAEMSLIEFLRNKQKACLKGNGRPADCDCAVCTATDSDDATMISLRRDHKDLKLKTKRTVMGCEDWFVSNEWQSFVEEDDIVVWKREDVNHRGKGLYCYKMYARYEDVTAYDFLEAQIDLDYRRSWDTHAVQLRLVDSEPATNSDVIYWETKWPKLFSNRDYVFKRRYRIDKKRNLIYLVNRITEHPSCPIVPSKQRVSEYWSYMIIRPQTTFDKPGIEFSLTYFDNPGTNVPSTLTLWITVTGMPDYLKKLRLAALGVAERRGDSPSPLASRDSSVCATDSVVSHSHTEQPCSTTLLLESLRGTLFLF